MTRCRRVCANDHSPPTDGRRCRRHRRDLHRGRPGGLEAGPRPARASGSPALRSARPGAVELGVDVGRDVDPVDEQDAVSPSTATVRRSPPPHVDPAQHGAGEVGPDEARATQVRVDELRPSQVVGPVKVAMRWSCGISGFSPRTLSCCTAQVLPSGSANPNRVPPSRGSRTWISSQATPRPTSSARAASASATTSCSPLSEPGAIACCAGRVPITIEQPEPWGVSWATSMCSLVVRWSRAKPTWSR